jgi:hypothetical protein
LEKIKIKTGKVITHIRELGYEVKNNRHICPLCREPIKQGKAYLLINNYELFPNVIVHDWCVPVIPIIDRLPEKDWKFTIIKLRDDFERAQKEREYNKCWFGDE